ncbi:MAG: hypothetical protein AAGC46_02240 [Solirubrobacteraceae bacterium]|nr:hypothetical protein [Patulibacter sp.]
MITEPTLMPDFRADLEQALHRRAAATATTTAPARRRVLPSPGLGGRLALGLAVLVAAIAVVFTSLPGHDSSRIATAGPRLLAEAGEPVPVGIRPGFTAQSVLGPDAVFQRAVRIAVPGGTAFAVKSQRGWCLYGPADPTGLPGVNGCALTSTIERVGMYVVEPAADGRSRVVALVPPGVSPPTIDRPDASSEPVDVADSGLVLATLDRTALLTLHAKSGADIVIRP